MRETPAHITSPALQKSAAPFFQRSADEGRDDNAFFSSVQAKLTVGQKDDPYEKEADSMADKVVNRSAAEVQAKSEPADNTVSKKSNIDSTPAHTYMQAKFESSEAEDKLQRKEDENSEPNQQKSPVAADGTTGTIQRSDREVDEGDKVFRSETGTPDMAGMSKRDAVIAMAKTMLGKIKAKQPGAGGERFGADHLWEIFKLAAPGVWTEDTVRKMGQKLPSWCGIFSVWAHKKVGIDLGNWQMGKGVTAFGTLKQTTSPQPGDIGYIDQPFQHHCIVTKVSGDTIESIDGNSGLYSEVVENTRPRTIFTGFFTAFSGGDGGTVSKKEADGGTTHAPDSIETSLASSKGGGSGLAPGTRSEMESGLGADFSGVKVHTDSNAAKMSQQLNAHAFTHGSDVYFNSGKFDPGSTSGKHLLAHELTHTIQQGAAPQVQMKDASARLTKATDKIATKTIKSSDVTITVVGNMYEITLKNNKKTYTLDTDGKTLEMPEITLPSLKKRNESLYKFPILSVRGRGKTLQVDNWVNAVKSAVNAKVYAFLLGENPGMKDSDTLYYKLGKRDSFHVIGDVKKIQESSYIPKWNRSGQPNNHQVDHILEYQLGGEDQPGVKPENYELLDAQANMSSGNAIRQERYDRIGEALGYFNDINTETPGKFPKLPSIETVKGQYLNKFAKVGKWNLPFNGNGKVYWTFDELTSAVHMKQLKKMTPAEVSEVAGSATEAVIYVGEASGSPKKLPLPFAGKQIKNFFAGMDLEQFTVNSGAPVAGTPAGTVEFTLNQKFTNRLKTGDNLKFNLMPIDGRLNTYFIKTSQLFNKNMFRKFEGLSPVTVNEMELDPQKGLMLSGTITCEVPFLKDLAIDFYIAGEEMGFSTAIDLNTIKDNFPKPFNKYITDVNLEISYMLNNSGDSGIGLAGVIGFEIEKLGKGLLKGGKKGKGFKLAGDFEFDKSLFDGEIHFGYEENKWSIGGSAKMNSKKIKGIKKADIHFDYKDEKLKAGGSAELTVPGISAVKIDSEIGADGNFAVTTVVDLTKVPRVKSGTVTVTIGKTAEGEWDLGIGGKVVPDIEFSGLTLGEVVVSYGKGIFDISISAAYDKNKVKATEMKFGITNRAVAADGTATGEGASEMNYYGGVTFEVTVTDELKGEIKSVLKPDGDITLDGKITLAADKKLLDIKPVNKNIFTLDKNIPLASCVVATLSLHIGGAVDLYANVDPLSIKEGSNVRIGNLSLKNYNNPQVDSTIKLGSKLAAGVKLTLEVGLDASLLGLIHAQIGGKGTLDFVAIEADAAGLIEMGWSPSGGFKIKEASVTLEMMSKLKASLDAYAKVYVDLWLTTINVWSHTWPVAQEEFTLPFFDKTKIKMSIPVPGTDNKLGMPDVQGTLAKVEQAATPDKVEKRTKNKLDGVGQTDEDRQAEVNVVTEKEVLAAFKNEDRFNFNQSTNYLETRYGLYDYLKQKSGLDPKIDLTFIDAEIAMCEQEEYDAFSLFIMDDKSFDNYSKSVIIEDFITNHPTLGPTELINLRNVVVEPVPPKPPLKTRAGKIPKKTPEQQPNAPKGPKVPVQKKAKNSSPSSSAIVEAGADGVMADGVFSDDPGGVDDFLLHDMAGFDDENDNIDNVNPDFMRPYSRTRRSLRQQSAEKSKSPFFTGPEKAEKSHGTAFFQAKLSVGSVDDPMEKEADQVADKVMGNAPKAAEKKDAPGKAAIAEAAAPEEKKDKDKVEVQKKSHETEKEEENKTVVKKKEKAGSAQVAKGKPVEAAIADKNGKGSQLPATTLHEMQDAFGNDFSDVHIHHDSEAATLSNELDAHAFTTGKDIYFNSGKFDPASESGKRLLAHELTHVVQQNQDTIRREPKKGKDKDPEKDRAQAVRDNYQKALKAKNVDWGEVAMYFNAFNAAEMQAKMSQLSGRQLFLLHQGAVYRAGVGPWSAAALNTTPVPGLDPSAAAAIEEQILQYNYQQAINLMTEQLSGKGVIDRSLLWGGKFNYLEKKDMSEEGRILAPGFDKTGKAAPTAANIGSDAFGESKGLPSLYSTILHEYQHVQQMQAKADAKSVVPGQSDDADAHLQQEVEAYGTELIHAKETGMFNNPDQMQDTWDRIQLRWDKLTDTRKKDIKDIYAAAYKVVKEAMGKKSFLVYNPYK